MGHYPSEIVLKAIQEWDIFKQGVDGLLELIENEWEYAEDGGFKRYKNNEGMDVLELHTYGWSGNEDILMALKQNFFFWSAFWWKSERGGHYWFEMKEIPKGEKS